MSKKVFIAILLLLALLAGFFNLMPHLLIKNQIEQSGDVYLPIQPVAMTDEALWYIPLAKKISENFLPVNDFYFEQYEHAPSPIPLLPNYIYSSLFLFSKNVTITYLISIFIFPIILFFLFYFLSWTLFKNRTWALFLTCIGILATVLIRNITRIIEVISVGSIKFITGNSENIPNIFNHLTSIIKHFIPIVSGPFTNYNLTAITDPLLTFLLYLPALAFLIIFIFKPTFKRAWFAGVFIGLLFYAYLFYVTFLSVIVGLFLIYNLIQFDKKIVIKILLLIGVICLISIPYLINIYDFYQLGQAEEISQRIGVEHGYNFRTIVWKEYVLYTVLLLINYLVFRKKDKPRFVFYSLALLAMFICYNLQVITGFMPHPDHWARTFNPLIFIIILDFIRQLIYSWKNINEKLIGKVLILLIFLMFFSGMVNVIKFFYPVESSINIFSFDKELYNSYKWIDSQSDPSVYISPSFITSYNFSIYSSKRAYLAPANFSSASNWELEQRFLEVTKLFGVSNEELKEILSNQDEKYESYSSLNRNIGFNLYSNYFQDQSFNWSFVNPPRRLPNEKIKELLNRYDKLEIKWEDFSGYYVYYGPFEEDVLTYSFNDEIFKSVYYSNKVNIYLIK